MIMPENGLYNKSNISGFKQTSRTGEHEGTVYYAWGLLKRLTTTIWRKSTQQWATMNTKLKTV